MTALFEYRDIIKTSYFSQYTYFLLVLSNLEQEIL